MTCCAGIVADDGRVFIGADSVAGGGTSIELRADAKVFWNRGYLVAFTTSFRMGQLIQFANLPAPEGDPFKFMVTKFVPEVRRALGEGGFRRITDEVETGGTFLVGWPGELFVIQDDFQVAQPRAGFTAIGCGADLALGALGATEGQPAARRIVSALTQAERFSGFVRRPFRLLWTGSQHG